MLPTRSSRPPLILPFDWIRQPRQSRAVRNLASSHGPAIASELQFLYFNEKQDTVRLISSVAHGRNTVQDTELSGTGVDAPEDDRSAEEMWTERTQKRESHCPV
jgi:hypothetical protein